MAAEMCIRDSGLAALDLGGQELRKRARKRPASDQVFDREMAAGELADNHCWSGPHDRGNYRCQAAPIGKLGIEQRVVFVELLAESVGNYFETRAPVSYTHLDVYKRQLLISASCDQSARVVPDFHAICSISEYSGSVSRTPICRLLTAGRCGDSETPFVE